MATVWLTYAWDDNKALDVDFVAQELISIGVGVKLDRWNVMAGRRLWEQIAEFIQDPVQSDAWVLYATQNSLGSEACREEFCYALDRALSNRGTELPIIGLFPAAVDTSLVPAGVRVRLCVSTTDPDWKERIKAAAEGRSASVAKLKVNPFHFAVHEPSADRQYYAMELRPRAGTWAPFIASIPLVEKETCQPKLAFGPAGRVPEMYCLMSTGDGPSVDESRWVMFAGNEATPTQSYFVFVRQLPSSVHFGVYEGQPQYGLERSSIAGGHPGQTSLSEMRRR